MWSCISHPLVLPKSAAVRRPVASPSKPDSTTRSSVPPSEVPSSVNVTSVGGSADKSAVGSAAPGCQRHAKRRPASISSIVTSNVTCSWPGIVKRPSTREPGAMVAPVRSAPNHAPSSAGSVSARHTRAGGCGRRTSSSMRSLLRLVALVVGDITLVSGGGQSSRAR